MSSAYDSTQLPDLLGLYYAHLFPAKEMYQWLSYGNDDFFSKREFSFTLTGDVYLRYQSFANGEEFKKELNRRNPEKIDIGAVYTQKPKMRESASGFQPVEKELVLDIDLTDYDDVRTCCQGAKVCEKCWKFLAVAVKILERALRKDFGFKHVLWVYSGRRGVHCWICDETARNLDTYGRGAVIEYLSVIQGGENQVKKVNITFGKGETLHPMLSQSIDIIEEYVHEICGTDQDVFLIEKNFNMLPDAVKQAATVPQTRYIDIMKYIERNKKEKQSFRQLYFELLLQFCYPRLDVNVSKGLNHLLKAPFCIHPKTGQVCVPFDPKKVDKFKTFEVPTVAQLIGEIDQTKMAVIEEGGEEVGSSSQWEKTSLSSYMKIFLRFLNSFEHMNDKSKESEVDHKRRKEYHSAGKELF